MLGATQVTPRGNVGVRQMQQWALKSVPQARLDPRAASWPLSEFAAMSQIVREECPVPTDSDGLK